jgi:hypothetical protein
MTLRLRSWVSHFPVLVRFVDFQPGRLPRFRYLDRKHPTMVRCAHFYFGRREPEVDGNIKRHYSYVPAYEFQVFCAAYSRIITTKSPSFYTTTFSASLTKLMLLLPQSHDCSCYVSTPVLAPRPFWLQKHNDLRAHGFAHSPNLWHQPRLANVICAWSWRLCGINLAHGTWLLWLIIEQIFYVNLTKHTTVWL